MSCLQLVLSRSVAMYFTITKANVVSLSSLLYSVYNFIVKIALCLERSDFPVMGQYGQATS